MFLLARFKSTPKVFLYLQGLRVHRQYVFTCNVQEYAYNIFLLARFKSTPKVFLYLQGLRVQRKYYLTRSV